MITGGGEGCIFHSQLLYREETAGKNISGSKIRLTINTEISNIYEFQPEIFFSYTIILYVP